MKILLVTEFFPENSDLKFTGGVEAYNYYLVKELTKKHQVTILCRRTGESNYNHLPSSNLTVIRLGVISKRIDTGFLTIPGRLFFLIQVLLVGLKLEFDLIQGSNFVTYPLTFLLGAIKRKPAIAWYPDVFVGKWIKLTGLGSGIIGEISERLSLKLPWDKVIALSQSTENKLLKFGIKPAKITTIYAGVSREEFKEIKPLKHKKFTICCIARLVSYKRVDLLISAVEQVRNRGHVIDLNIIGEGPEKNRLVDLVDKLKLTEQIIFDAKLSRHDLVQKLKSADLFCLPSQEEGFGLVVIEAAACGVPYLVSDIPVLREITFQGLGGQFFKPGDVKNLSQKILEICNDKNLRHKLSQQTKQLVANYSWQKIANQFNEVYRELATHKLHVLMLVDAWFPHWGGGQAHVWELSKQLVNLGCLVTILTRNLGDWDEKYEGIKVICLGHFEVFANIIGRVEYLLLATWYSLTAGYDIWHGHAFSPGLIAPLVKLFRSKPIVFTIHGRGVKIAGLNMGISWLEDLIVYKIPYDLEISVAEKTLTQKPIAKNVEIIPNGVDLKRFLPAQRTRKKIKNILYVGRLSYEKGVDLLIEAFRKLNNPRYQLIIVGDGPEMSKLTSQARQLNIKFTGTLIGPELVDQYRQADLFILPSRTEGQPLTLFEAWAAKLPVLATKVGDNHTYIKDGENGFLAEPNIDSIENAIGRAVKSDKLISMADNNWRRVQNYSWDKVGLATINCYEILKKRNAPILAPNPQ